MTNYEDEDTEQRLARLARATEGLHPTSGFSARVMLAIQAESSPSFWDSTWFSSRRLLPIAAIAAALAVGWAASLEHSVDDELATSYASAELE